MALSRDQWSQVLSTFEDVLVVPNRDRSEALKDLCGEQRWLRSEVESLLRAHDRMEDDGFLCRPAISLHPIATQLERIGPYAILRPLGEGGMGRVYLARSDEGDPRHEQVAVKVLDGDRASLSAVRRFRIEREILADLDHPHIAKFLDAGTTTDGRHYMVMQYLEGRSLDRYCSEEHLDLRRRVCLMAKICDVVQVAHENLVVHRDLKPSNVLVGADGQPTLLDFGVARSLRRSSSAKKAHTATGRLPMTPRYASPEHVTGVPVTASSDVFSLGVMLYELVTGVRPLAVDGLPPHRLAEVLSERHPAPPSRHLPTHWPDAHPNRRTARRIDRVVLKCLRKEPELRYSTAGELAKDLRVLLGNGMLQARGNEWLYRRSRWLRRHRQVAFGVVVASILFVGLGVASLLRELQARERTALALHYGHKGERIESISRSLALLPGYTAEDRRKIVRSRIAEIEDNLAHADAAGRGPAHYALGRGHLAMGQNDRAREYLETAWSLGFQTPDAAGALGIALGEIYREALTSLESMEDQAARARKKQRIETQLRDPAMEFLRIGRSGDESRSRYLAALTSYYGGELDEAARRASDAHAAAPWLFEARLLQADIELRRGRELAAEYRLDEAAPVFETAKKLYREVQTLAPSEARAYAGECVAWMGTARSLTQPELLEESILLRADSACRTALEFEETVALHLTRTSLYRLRVDERIRRAKSPARAFDEARRSVHRATEIDPTSSQVLQASSSLFQLHGRWLAARGEDPTASLDQAYEAVERALDLHPRSAGLLAARGNATFQQALWQADNGGDPRTSYASAISDYEKAASLSPSFVTPRANLASLLSSKGHWLLNVGQSPVQSFESALQWFRTLADLDQVGPGLLNNLGSCYLGLAESRYLEGGDPSPDLTAAVRVFENAAATDSEAFLLYFNLSLARRIEAQYQLANQESPLDAIHAGLESADRALAMQPSHGSTYGSRAALHLLEARWHSSRRLRDRAASQAQIEAERGLELRPELATLHLHLAEVLLYRAQWARSSPSVTSPKTSAWLERARAAVDEAERLDPNRRDAIVLGALVRYQQCLSTGDGCRLQLAEMAEALDATGRQSPMRRPIYERWQRDLTDAAPAAGS